jgi:hypothetical protein
MTHYLAKRTAVVPVLVRIRPKRSMSLGSVGETLPGANRSTVRGARESRVTA